MDQPTRVFKMLVCLVAAMTGTAALLGWLDPTPASTPNGAGYDEVVRLARSAVSDDVTIRRDQWREVEIAADSVLFGGTLLSATAGGNEPHFHVGHDGRPVRGGPWRDQRTTPRSPYTIRIRVSRRAEAEPMSPAQWLGVRVLVAALTEAIAPDDRTLPVRLGNGWAAVYGIEPGSVFEFVPPEVTSG